MAKGLEHRENSVNFLHEGLDISKRDSSTIMVSSNTYCMLRDRAKFHNPTRKKERGILVGTTVLYELHQGLRNTR